MKTALLILAALLALSGCAANGMKAQVMGANIEIAKERAQAAAKPVLNASIPVPGCKAPEGANYKDACVMTIVVHAPQSPNSGQVTMPDDPWARVADRGMGVLGTGLGIFLGGEAAIGLVNAAGSGIVNALKVQPAPTVVNQPAPVIVAPAETVVVEQAPPVIVTQPEPIIVEQPEPIVIQPVFAPSAVP